MRTIILGCSRQGALLAKILEKDGIDITVIDLDSESFNRLENFKGRKILGDGTLEKTLESAGISDCDAFISATGSDNINLMAAQIARAMFNVPNVICQVFDPRRATIYSELGLDTFNFSLPGARLIKSMIVGGGVVRKIQLGNGTGVSLEVRIDNRLNGKKVSEMEKPGIFRIAAVIRGFQVIIPEPDMVVKTEDHIVGVVLSDQLKEILESLCPAQKKKPSPEQKEAEK